MPLFRRRPQGLCQDDKRAEFDRNLPSLGRKQDSLGADNVSQVQVAKNIELLVTEHVLLGVHLDSAALVAHIDEHALAHVPVGGYPAGDGYLAPFDIVPTRLPAFFSRDKLVLEGVNAFCAERT